MSSHSITYHLSLFFYPFLTRLSPPSSTNWLMHHNPLRFLIIGYLNCVAQLDLKLNQHFSASLSSTHTETVLRDLILSRFLRRVQATQSHNQHPGVLLQYSYSALYIIFLAALHDQEHSLLFLSSLQRGMIRNTAFVLLFLPRAAWFVISASC